jgi:hypothetical protein
VKKLAWDRRLVVNEQSSKAFQFNLKKEATPMLRSVLGVIVGYIVMFVLQVIAFMTIYTMMGADWSFKPASYDPSTAWIAMQFSVILITTIIAGFICAVIARGGKSPLVLAVVVLVLGLALAFSSKALRPADTHEVRAGNVPNMEAMNKARPPAWVIFLGPVIGAAGVLIGGKLKRRA